jgi:hypothetical protein
VAQAQRYAATGPEAAYTLVGLREI